MRWVLCLLVCFFAVSPLRAADFSGPAKGSVVRVIDGDTVKMRVAIWLDQEILVSVRLADVDAPELFRPKCEAERTLAQAAKRFAEDFLRGGEAGLENIEQDKYGGRVVARIEANGADLGAAMTAAGLAARGRRDWCAG